MTAKKSSMVVTRMLMATVLMVGGCDKLANTSKSVQSVTMRSFNDAQSSWKDFFTYHPPLPAPMPQTRYCYQMQSDIVCYDSEQPRLTAKLIGYQDGDKASWIQPGGGSLGASGGAPVALRPMPAQSMQSAQASQAVISSDTMINTGPVADADIASGSSLDISGGTSSSQISVNSLPPTTPFKKKK